MTVNFEVPVIKYLGNGVTTDYTFKWSSGYPDEIYVTLDGTLLKEGVEYELEDYTEEFGGTIRFYTAPAANEAIIIYRETPITQQVDYQDFLAFPADTHEFQMDKDTRILQEMIWGARSLGGRVDLNAVQYETYVEVENTSGDNALLLPWTTDGLLSGVSLGEVVPYGNTIPVDGTPTAKEDGYIWWCLGPLPFVGGDPNIVMSSSPLTVSISKASPIVAIAEFRYNAVTGDIEYGFNSVDLPWDTVGGISTPPSALEEYWIKFEVLTGSAIERDNSPVDTWIDAYAVIGETDEFNGWYVQNPGSPSTVQAIFTIAPDDGFGAPDEGQAISRYVTLTATQT